MKVTYNSPVILTFAVASVAVLVISMTLPGFRYYFTLSPECNFASPVFYFKLISYIFGHVNVSHLAGNVSLVLLIGPTLEEKYGSKRLISMIVVTALVTAIIHLLLFNNALLGASGIVFMLIILSSFTNIKKGEIPLTFVLVAFLYIGSEVAHSFSVDKISQFAHILGGVVGGIFGLKFAVK